MPSDEIFVLERWPKDLAAQTEFEAVDDVLGPAPRCPNCGEFIGPLRWLPPYRARLVLCGTSFGDLVFGAGNDILLSDRARSVIQENDLTISSPFEPVEVVGVRGGAPNNRPPPEYWHVEVPISAAAIDDQRSGVERNGPAVCEVCRTAGVKRLERVVLEPGAEPEEDLFVARGFPGVFLASARLRAAFMSHGLSNAVFVPGRGYRFDDMDED